MKKTIMLVDDSQFVQDLFSFAIKASGFEFLSATEGLEALELLERHPVDILIVDINMPGMDGYTLVKKIREIPKFIDKPVVIMTTQAEAGDREKGFLAGADAYMIKPVHPNEMIAQIRLLIGE